MLNGLSNWSIKRVCLINPPQLELYNPISYPPLGLLYIAAHLRMAGHKVIVHNMPSIPLEQQFNKIPEADIYGITCTSPTIGTVNKLSKLLKVKFPFSRVVIGGIHPTLLPEETLRSTGADNVFVGEGELMFSDFCYSPNTFPIIIEAPRIYNLDSLEFPARQLIDKKIIQDDSGIHLAQDIIKMEKWGKGVNQKTYASNNYATTVITSRGCPYRCAFCSKSKLTGGVRYRSPKNIFNELLQLEKDYQITQFRIIDDVVALDRFRLQELMEMTAKKGNFYFTTILRADSIKDKKMLQDMYIGGVRIVSIGVESGSQKILDMINKKETIQEMEQAIAWCKEVKLKTKVFIIFGLPGETLETIEETKQFFIKNKPDMYTLSSFQPLPGSDIFENSQKYSIELKEDYNYSKQWFYYEPEDYNKGFPYKMSLKLRQARGELIRYLRGEIWKK